MEETALQSHDQDWFNCFTQQFEATMSAGPVHVFTKMISNIERLLLTKQLEDSMTCIGTSLRIP